MNKSLLVFNDRGIYCEQADVYIDAWKPVHKVIITHGHADHARPDHRFYITHELNAPIIKHRLGAINVTTVQWGESFTINGVRFSLHPAGHIIGSSQVRVEYRGEVWVFTGDFKREDDGLTTPFELVKCHTMITECTFGLPVFKWKPQAEVTTEINEWWRQNQAEDKTSVIFSYTLGKAQRIMTLLDPSLGKIYTHGAVQNMNEVLHPIVQLPETIRITSETKKESLRGQVVIAPPSAHGSTWIRRLTPFVTASASGWMAFRGARRRRAIDKGFVISDHADWDGLLDTIRSSGATRVICTHGYTDLFARYLRDIGYDASTEKTAYEGETSEIEAS